MIVRLSLIDEGGDGGDGDDDDDDHKGRAGAEQQLLVFSRE